MRRSVLLVDDVADLRFLLRTVLETDGSFQVVGEAGDGESAVALAERTRPNVVVLDLSMPTMDGLEALPRLRELLPDATIAVLSGFEGARLAASASALGADAYFQKGTPPSDVLDGLKDLLGMERTVPAPTSPAKGSVLADAELHAMVAHDLRSPLGGIIGFGQTLELRWDELDDGTRRTLVGHMTAQARTLQALTDNLLAAQSIDLNAVDVDLEPVAPAALLTDLAGTLETVSGEHPLDVRIDPHLPVVLVDRMRMVQILVNLVSNAERHAPPGTPIVLSARSDGAWVAVEVIDCGPGIPYADRVRVLEKHVRLRSDGRGLGLGLFVASSMARAMGGSLAVADAERGGARIVCRLQVADVSG